MTDVFFYDQVRNPRNTDDAFLPIGSDEALKFNIRIQ